MQLIHPRKRWPAIVIACAVNLALLFSLLPAPMGGANTALAASSTVVISQIYGGGGNSGAIYKNDFIELFNRGSVPVSLAGWSVQYASSSGVTWQKTDLTGVLQPGQYYLVQEALGAGGTVSLPTPDATGSIAMSATSGKVVLASTNIPFSGACPSGSVVDFVGFGAANCSEGAPTPTLSNTTDAIRLANGCTDTDNNSQDFIVGTPAPRNTASPLSPCNVPTPTNPTGVGAASPAAIYGGEATLLTVAVTLGANPTSTDVSVSANLATIGGAVQPLFDDGSNGDAVANDLTYSYLLTPPANASSGAKTLAVTVSDAQGRSSVTSIALTIRPPLVAIHDVQGAAHLSPYANQPVTIRGIVTALRTAGSTRGFYVQEVAPDADDATSEGVFVFTGSNSTPAAQAAVGDLVEVSGAVIEFRSGGNTSTNLTVTELTGPLAITRIASGNALPAPIVLGTGGRIPPGAVIEDDAAGSVETSGVFDPANDGIDFYESLEGMYVQVNDALATGATRDFTTNREISVVGDNGANASVLTPHGGIVLSPGDFNPERIILNDWIANGPTLPSVSVGATFPGVTSGVMDYSFGNFKLEVSALPGNNPSPLVREVAAPAPAHQLAIATYNVENLDPGDGAAKFDALAGQIVNNLQSPDLIAIEEVQDNNGPTDNGVVAADQTLALLVTAIQNAGGPTYETRLIDPANNQDGGEPGGNIRQGFLFRTDRGLSFVDRPGGDAITPVGVVAGAGGPELTLSPGRIDPTNSAFNSSRKPLVGEFYFRGDKLFVVANHFNSKGGDDPLYGRFQPPTLVSEVQRIQQAQAVRNFVQSVTAIDPNANIVVLGDLNDFQFSPPLTTLANGLLTILIDTLPASERYTYVFDGNSQALDHTLISAGLASKPFTYDVIHANAEYVDQISDHDPQVAFLCVDRTPPLLSVAATPNQLWPPNHQLVPVRVAVSAGDNGGVPPTVKLVSAVSNQPQHHGLSGGGHGQDDIVILSDFSFLLRAERNEGSRRIYTLTYRATDGCGNSTMSVTTVTVPKSKDKKDRADSPLDATGVDWADLIYLPALER